MKTVDTNYYRSVVELGMALFSMFFGSGNLVFPLELGVLVKGEALNATLGLLLSAALFPMIGVIALFLYDGNEKKMFRLFGWGAPFWMPLIALSLMGPFGVAARCVVVAYGGFSLLFPSVSLSLFSAIFCLFIFLAAYRESRIIPLLGTFLSPCLLISLLVIAMMAMMQPFPGSLQDHYPRAFSSGILQGYQLMDLVAALFFSSFVINQVKKKAERIKVSVASIFLPATCIAVILLSIVYALFVFIGSSHYSLLRGISGEMLLPKIAELHLGFLGAILVSVAMILACFTTAIVLCDLFCNFIKREFFPAYQHTILAVTVVITFLVSTLEFSGISRFLNPILQTLYPALILFTLMAIFHKSCGMRFDRRPVMIIFAISFMSSIFYSIV